MHPLRHSTKFALPSPVLLVLSGMLWGWLWVSIVHIVPLFYIIAPVVNIAGYGIVGVWLHRRLSRHVHHESLRAVVGVIAIALFYGGERVIWLGWIFGVWPFDSGSVWSPGMYSAWELSVVIVGLAAVRGLWNRVHRFKHYVTNPRSPR